MCKKSNYCLYGQHKIKDTIILCDLDCDSWRCPECAEKLLKLHQLRIIEAAKVTLKGDWTFATITAHENWRGNDRSLANLRQGWTKLIERLRRKNGTRHYVLIHERHADGTLHMHMLYNAVIRTKWLKDNCRACGLGYQARAEALKDPASAGGYVTKYLTKAISQGDEFPLRFKRVRYSVGFPKFDMESAPSEFDWQRIPKDSASDYRREAIHANRPVIDVRGLARD